MDGAQLWCSWVVCVQAWLPHGTHTVELTVCCMFMLFMFMHTHSLLVGYVVSCMCILASDLQVPFLSCCMHGLIRLISEMEIEERWPPVDSSPKMNETGGLPKV